MVANRKSIAVILSGSGHQDGSEIHEATLTLLAIHKNGYDFQCYAPDIAQHHVLNHLTGKEMEEERNVLIESARIARGQVTDLSLFKPADHEALVIPGGLGAAKNLSTFAFDGADCVINRDVQQAVEGMVKASKPIGALCIAPVILARLIDNALLTIGHSPEVSKALLSMGARHQSTMQAEIVVDRERKLVTTPCYMLDARVNQIAKGAERLIQEIIALSTN